MATVYTSYVGIDVAKLKFDIYLSEENLLFSQNNDSSGIESLLERLPTPGSCLIVIESTGNYHQSLVAALFDKGQHIAVVNPARVRELAKAMGILAKTDKIDAKLLAKFGEMLQPRKVEKESQKMAEFALLLSRRRQLVEMRKRETQHMEGIVHKKLLQRMKEHIEVLSKQLEEIDALLTQHIEQDQDLKFKADILKSVPGIGDVSMFTLMVNLPELGNLNRQKIAALVGVAPFNADSGKMHGKRSIRGGREKIRRTLFMAARTAMTHNPLIRAFSERLTAANKPYKVVAVACIRKLLSILNTMVKNKTAWKY